MLKLFGYSFDLSGWHGILLFIANIVIVFLAGWLLTRLNHRIFRKIQKKRKNLQLSFFEHIASILIVLAVLILGISAFDGTKSVWQTLLGGTAIVSAVLAFAAQDVIKDILAGLMLSLHHPFEIGNRVELEDGTDGIVEEMTMRHVVIAEPDTVRKVIPNSRINAMTLTNYSYRTAQHSITFRFSVGYDTDIEQAKQIVRDAIIDCPRTVPEKKQDGSAAYRPVYFISFADSALILETTVYYEAGTSTELVKDEVNTRVREALLRNHIEIPYNYITVVQQNK